MTTALLCLSASSGIALHYVISSTSMADYDAIDPEIVDSVIYTDDRDAHVFIGHLTATTHSICFRKGFICSARYMNRTTREACDRFAKRIEPIIGDLGNLYDAKCASAATSDSCESMLNAIRWNSVLKILIVLALIAYVLYTVLYWILPKMSYNTRGAGILFGCASAALLVSFHAIIIDTAMTIGFLVNQAIPVRYPYIFVTHGIGLQLVLSSMICAGISTLLFTLKFIDKMMNCVNIDKLNTPILII